MKIRYVDLVQDLPRLSQDVLAFTDGDFCFDLDALHTIINKKPSWDFLRLKEFLLSSDGKECYPDLDSDLLVQLEKVKA